MTKSLENEKGLNEKLKEAVPMHRGADQMKWWAWCYSFVLTQPRYVTGQTLVVDGGQMIRGLVPVENNVYAGKT